MQKQNKIIRLDSLMLQPVRAHFLKVKRMQTKKADYSQYTQFYMSLFLPILPRRLAFSRNWVMKIWSGS